MIQESSEKFILDVTCGSRSIWFQKSHPNALYIDKRVAKKRHEPHRPNHCVKPDLIADFTDLPFDDESYNLVIWDPPHLKDLSDNSIMAKKYGSLKTETWPYELSKGFDECMRVLKPLGVLIFKWSWSKDVRAIPLKEVLSKFSQKPLFGHTTGSSSLTYWMCFMKIPK